MQEKLYRCLLSKISINEKIFSCLLLARGTVLSVKIAKRCIIALVKNLEKVYICPRLNIGKGEYETKNLR